MKIIFAGTPDFSVPCLEALIANGHEVLAVYCQPDRPAGRGRKLQAGPVKQAAQKHGIEVLQPVSLKTEFEQAQLASFNADVMVVVAYGLLLPQAVLDTPRLGCINVHASLLPRWRGAAPIQRCIEAGDKISGVTIMQMDAGLDTGDMLLKTPLDVPNDMTGGQLHDALSALGAQALLQTLANMPEQITPQRQDASQACYAHKLDKADACIDWQQSAQLIHDKIRAFNPWPVCWTTLGEERIRLWTSEVLDGETQRSAGEVIAADRTGIDVACGQGLLRLTQLQMPGQKALPIADFANGHDLAGWIGQHFG